MSSRESFPQFLRRTGWIWCGFVVVYSLIAANLPPTDDEVYYWTWSQSLQLSYYDHPGMVAWLIWLSTCVFGDSILGMRFPACGCVALTLCVIAYLTTRLPQSPTMASVGPLLRSVAKAKLHPLVLGVILTPLFTVGAILITPDAPLLACWALYLLWLVAIQERLEADAARPIWPWWVLGGVLLGLGGLSKYTMILAVPAGFASFLLSNQPWRKWFLGYLGHGVVSVLVASPILLYNVQHHFEPLLFQWRHAMHDAPATVITFLEFFGVQVVLFGTLPFFITPWTVRQLLHLTPLSPGGRGAGGEGDVTDTQCNLHSTPLLRVCSCLFLVPLAFFIYKAARTELEGNWGLVTFISVWPVAAAWYATVEHSPFWRRMTAAGFAIPAVCVLGLTVHLLMPLPILPAKFDRLSKYRGRWEMAQHLAATIHKEPLPLFHYTYQLPALLRYWGVDARQEGTLRPSHYTFPPQHIHDCPAAYFVTEGLAEPILIEGMASPEFVGVFPTVANGETVHEFQLWRYEAESALRTAGHSEPVLPAERR